MIQVISWKLDSSKSPLATQRFSAFFFHHGLQGQRSMRCAPPSRWDNLWLSKISHGILQKKTKHRRRGWTHFLVLHPLLRKIQNPSLARLVRNSPSRNANLITKLGTHSRSFQSDIRVFHATMLKVLRHGAIWEELQKTGFKNALENQWKWKLTPKFILHELCSFIYTLNSIFVICGSRMPRMEKNWNLKKKLASVGRDLFQKFPNFNVQSNIRPNVFDILV